MAKRTPGEVYAALVAAGFPPAQAVTMTAIAGAESGWRDDALGDVGLANATWGPSFGLFQIRTLKRDTGRGTDRDITALTGNLGAQARAAWEISRHGADFTPWTVYRTGRYRDFLGQAQAAAGGPASPGDPAGPFPTFGPGWLPWNWPSEAGNAAVGAALGGARHIGLETAGAVLGLALVAAGAAVALSPRIRGKIADGGRAVKAVL